MFHVDVAVRFVAAPDRANIRLFLYEIVVAILLLAKPAPVMVFNTFAPPDLVWEPPSGHAQCSTNSLMQIAPGNIPHHASSPCRRLADARARCLAWPPCCEVTRLFNTPVVCYGFLVILALALGLACHAHNLAGSPHSLLDPPLLGVIVHPMTSAVVYLLA